MMSIQQLGSDFQVTPERNIFRVSVPVELLQKVGRVSWNVFSAVVFPVGITRLAVNNLARRAILPACLIWNIREIRRQLQSLQEKQSSSIGKIELLTRRIERIEDNHIELNEGSKFELEVQATKWGAGDIVFIMSNDNPKAEYPFWLWNFSAGGIYSCKKL